MSAAKRRIKRKIKIAILQDRTERRMRMNPEIQAARVHHFFHCVQIPVFVWFLSRGRMTLMMDEVMRARRGERGAS